MIGPVLKEKRLAMGINLERVSAELKIKTSYLKALEEENFDIFPADVYTIGYLRAYATYLGLDPEPLIEEFKALKEKLNLSQLSDTSHLEEKSIQQSVRTSTVDAKKGSSKIFKPHLLILMVILLTGGVIISSVFKTQKPKNSQEQETRDLSSPLQIPPAIPSKDKKSYDAEEQRQIQSQIPPESSSLNPQEEGYNLSIIAQELTWLKVESEEGIHDITMKPGDKVKYSSKKGFRLIIGNAGGIRLSLNGKDMGSLGKSGEVKIINIP